MSSLYLVFVKIAALLILPFQILYGYLNPLLPVSFNDSIKENTTFQQFVNLVNNLSHLQFGANQINFVSGRIYKLSGSGVTSSATSVGLTSFTIPNSGQKLIMSDFGSIGYGTFEPTSPDRKEFFSFTTVTQNSDNTATLGGITRGLSPITPYTASSTLQKAHAGGTTVVISNPPQLYNEAGFKGNNEVVTGLWQFTQIPWSDAVATATNQFATRAYANALTIANAVPAATNTIGFVEIAAPWEVASSTWAANSTTTVDARNALHAGLVTLGFSPVSTSSIVGTLVSGKIHPNLIATTSDFTYRWASVNIFTGSTTMQTGTTTFNGRVALGADGIFSSTTWGWFGIDQSSTDSYLVQLEPSPTKYDLGMKLFFKSSATNTQAATINVNNLGAKTITRKNGVDLNTGDIRGGVLASLVYDGANFQLQNPQVADVEMATNQVFSGSPPRTWSQLQLGTQVGTTSSTVMLRVRVSAGSGTSTISFRRGDEGVNTVSTGAAANTVILSADRGDFGYLWTSTDASGTVMWICNGDCGTTAVNLESYWDK